MSISRNNTYFGAFLIAIAMLSFAIGNVIVTMLKTLPITQILFVRAIFGVFFLSGYILCTGKKNSFKTKAPALQIFQGIISYISLFFIFYSFILLPFAEATTLSFCCVLFIALLSIPVLKQKVSRANWVAIIIGFFGVIIVSQPSGTNISSYGVLIAILAALTESIVILLSRPLGEKDGPLTFSFYQMLFSLIISIPIFLYAQWPWPSPEDLFLLACLACLGIIGCLCIVKAYTIARAAAISPMVYTMIIWGSIFGYFIWDQLPAQSFYIGAALIISSGIYILRHESKAQKHKG